MSDVQHRTTPFRISESGWAYVPAVTVLQRYRAGRAVGRARDHGGRSVGGSRV